MKLMGTIFIPILDPKIYMISVFSPVNLLQIKMNKISRSISVLALALVASTFA
jgi:hypothetical protein